MCKFLICIVSFLAVFSCLKAATIRGTVKDATTGESLIGSTIYIRELNKGTVSGLNGTYIIKNVPKGIYKISCSYIGYLSVEKKISVGENDVSVVNFNMTGQTSELDEVKIVSYRNKSTDISARSSEKHADQVINVVSAKTIELSPDLNVANVIQRVSGVTIERNATGDGQYAILRGMDKRFSYTMVNGVKLPGTNNKYRYVPLDIFPSSMIGQLEVTKALTPNMEGDAIGGAVNMIMKDAPDRLQFNLNIAGGYNQLLLERNFMGFNSQAVNSKSPFEINGDNFVATPKDFTIKNLDLEKYSAKPNLVGDFSVGNRFFNKKLGVLLAGSYSNNYRATNSLTYGTENDTTNLPELTGKSTRFTSEQSSQIGLHGKIDFKINNRHEITLYNVFMNSTTAQVRESQGSDFGNSSNSLISYSLRYRLNKQQLVSSVIQGDHILSEKIKVQWSGVHGLAKNQTPDYINLSLFSEIINNTKLPLTVSNGGSTRRWEHNSDEDWAGYLNLSYLPVIAGIPVDLSLGGLYRNKQRTSFFNEYRFFADLNSDYKSMQGRDWNTFSEIQWKNSVDLNNNDPLNFSAGEIINAGYGQFKFQMKKLQALGGLRVENTDQSYFLKYTKGDVPPIGKQNYTDLLPGIHLKYKTSEKQNLRFSYFRSINRPGFLEIVPYLVNAEEYTEMGNPDIKHTTADNFDIRYEYFPKPLDQFMVGAFYKSIQNPIEYGWSNPQGSKGNIYYMPDNFGNAKNYGMEVDFIKYFRFLGVKANYTYTNSEITTWKRYRAHTSNGWQLDSIQQTRPLFGQSAHVVNLSLLFKDTRTGWDAQVSANYTGDRIFLVSRYLDDDQWQKGVIQMDASVEKKFKSRFSIFAKAKNLLNSPMEVYIKKVNPTNSTKIDQNMAGNKTTVRQDYYMQTYLLGIRYQFR